jgi:small subunit ribosomal protein S18
MIDKRKSVKRRIRRKPVHIGDITQLTYKNVGLLRRLVTEQGAILPREETSLTQKQQRKLATAVKRARHLALLPFTQTL